MCLDGCERGQLTRQLVLLGHPRTGDQDREDGDVAAPERGLDLDSQVVVGIVEAKAAMAVRAVGVVGGLAGEGETPFWLRYHHTTSSYWTVALASSPSRCFFTG